MDDNVIVNVIISTGVTVSVAQAGIQGPLATVPSGTYQPTGDYITNDQLNNAGFLML